MMAFRWLLVWALLLPSWSMAASAPTATATIPAADLQADVDVLQRAYEALHPGLYRYNTPARMQERFDQLRARFDRPRTLREVYLAFSEFAATIRCGHTYANFYNQTKAVTAALFDPGLRVPFEFRWIDDQMVVTRDLTGRDQLPPGTTITAINGVATADILARLLPIARADGGNDAKRIALLEVQGLDRYETFDIYLSLYYPDFGPRLRMSTRAAHDRTRVITVDGLSDAQRQAARHEAPDDPHAGWRFAFDGDIAVLRTPNWALYDSDWDWKAYLDDVFGQVARRAPRAMVIDLRGNEGGLDVGDAMLAHLIDKPLAIYDPPRRVRYRRVPEALVPYLDTWDASFKDWGQDAVPHDDRFFTLLDDDGKSGGRTIAPKAPRFAGRVFVLIDAANSSATFQFAERVRAAGVATLVGQTTGGNQRGINGGAFFFLRLPHSGIELDLPLIARFPDGERPDAGITPDILVARTVADIRAGRDAEMTAVRAALR